MAEIPVERKTGGAFPWWLIPLILLLLLLPLLYFCGRNTAVVDNTNNNSNYNGNRTVTTVTGANNSAGSVTSSAGNTSGAGTTAIVTNTGATNTGSGNSAAFNEDERIREANEKARLAMEKIYPGGTAQQVIEALNLSIVNFAKGSANIPEGSKPLLKQAAEMLKKSPADTRVEVDGYTDNDGDDAGNQKLSERRANSVRSALISYGVPAAMLSSKGYGEANPKASNDTPEGKFQNRRIEYKVATSDSTAEKVAPNGR